MKNSLPFRGGEPSLDGGGVLWNLLLVVKDLRDNPSVSPLYNKNRHTHALLHLGMAVL